MWFLQPKDDYVSQMPWKHADEPAVMSWQIRARDYPTLPFNCMLLFLAIIAVSVGYFFASLIESLLWRSVTWMAFSILPIVAIMGGTHRTTIIVYRFTEAGAEVCSWSPQADALKPVLKWLSIILFPVVGVIILIDPSTFIAAIGPVGIGLTAWMMGSSKAYQETQRNTRHDEIEWSKTEAIKVWRKRSIISLTYQWKPYSKNSRYRPLTRLVYCHKDELDERVRFFREHLPNASYEEGKIDV